MRELLHRAGFAFVIALGVFFFGAFNGSGGYGDGRNGPVNGSMVGWAIAFAAVFLIALIAQYLHRWWINREWKRERT